MQRYACTCSMSWKTLCVEKAEYSHTLEVLRDTNSKTPHERTILPPSATLIIFLNATPVPPPPPPERHPPSPNPHLRTLATVSLYSHADRSALGSRCGARRTPGAAQLGAWCHLSPTQAVHVESKLCEYSNTHRLLPFLAGHGTSRGGACDGDVAIVSAVEHLDAPFCRADRQGGGPKARED